MSHGIEKVIERDMCVGCGACAHQTRGAVSVTLGARGFYGADIGRAQPDEIAAASRVCPFSDDAKNEDELAATRNLSSKHDGKLGYYREIWAGRITDDSRLLGSSSGGLTSWFLEQLLQRDEIDGVIHVGRAPGGHFEYRVSTTAGALRENRKSDYSAVTLVGALDSIRDDGMRYALVGVPCFIKASRLLANEDLALAEQLKMYVGLVCGHLKSQFFAESLAWQAGVPPAQLEYVDFRVKNPLKSSSDYDYAVKSITDPSEIVRPMSAVIDGNWGYGAFQPNACNYCDDVFAETADVAFADAWLPEYRDEWRGTNVLLSRSELASSIFRAGQVDGSVQLEPLSADAAAASQAGNYRHRRDGLAVRLADDIAAGESVPTKRVRPGYGATTVRRRALIRQRRQLSKMSLLTFGAARAAGDLDLYTKPITREIYRYRALDILDKGWAHAWRRVLAKVRRRTLSRSSRG